MGLELAKAYVRIQGDASALRQDLSDTRQMVESAMNSIRGVVLGILAPIALMGKAFLKESTNMAGDANEIRSKFEAVFKDMTDKADVFVKEFSARVGRGIPSLERSMAEFQDTFVPLGFARDKAAELSMQLTELTEDLASFNNTDSIETQRLLTSAIVGNHEAVRRFGIIITETTLKQELSNMKIKGGVKAATELDKAQARLNIIMKNSSDALGDATRTAGSFVNIGRAMESQINALKVGIGRELIGAFTVYRTAVAEAARATLEMIEATGALVPYALAGATAMAGLGAAIFGTTMAMRFFGVSWKVLLAKLAVGVPVAAGFLAIGAALGALVAWAKDSKYAMEVLNTAFSKVTGGIAAMKAAFSGWFERNRALLTELGVLFDEVLTGFIIKPLVGAFNMLADLTEGPLKAAGSVLGSIATSCLQALRLIMDGLSFLSTNWSLTWEMIKISTAIVLVGIANSAIVTFNTMVGAVVACGAAMWSAMKDTGAVIVQVFVSVAKTVMNLFKAMWEGIKGVANGKDFWDSFKKEFMKEILAIEKSFKDLNKNAEDVFQSTLKAWLAGGGGPWDELLKTLKDDLERVQKKIQEERDAGRKRREEKPEEKKKKEAAEEAKKAEEINNLLKPGRYKFESFGEKFQDALLGFDKQKLDKDRNALLEAGNKLQEETTKAVKDLQPAGGLE